MGTVISTTTVIVKTKKKHVDKVKQLNDIFNSLESKKHETK